MIPEFSADPSDPEFYLNPYKTYALMHPKGPVIFWKQYQQTCFIGFEQVTALLRDRRFGREITHVMTRQEAGLPDIPEHLEPFYAFEANSMLEREPPVHTRLRKLVNRAFVSRRIEMLAPVIEKLCHELIDRFPENEPFDLLPAYCEKIPVMVIADLLGVPRSMADQLLEWSHAMVAMYQFGRTRAVEDRAVAATAAFSEYISALANERNKAPQDDLLSALVQMRDADNAGGETLSMDELVTTVILLLNAGHEATVHALGNSVSTLLQVEVDTKTVFSQEAGTMAAIEELLRFDPPLHMFTRFALEDIEFAGVPLKKGQSIGLLLGAANHDPDRFENPWKLDFVRGGTGHTSFGGGIHFCLGAPLARLEMSIALPVLFQRQPHLCLCEKPRYADRYHFHGLERLLVMK